LSELTWTETPSSCASFAAAADCLPIRTR